MKPPDSPDDLSPSTGSRLVELPGTPTDLNAKVRVRLSESSKPEPKKKKPRTDYRKQADLLFATAVRGIGFCEECGSQRNLQCAHIISRSYSRIRVDFRNAVCLCQGCHMFFTNRPLEWEEWVTARIGIGSFRALRQIARTGPDIDWKLEALRLKTDVPFYRPEPQRLFRKAP